MESINLRGQPMTKRKRKHGRDLRPETTTTGNRWTKIPDPRASARFAVGDRVAWDEGDRILLGTVIAYVPGDSYMVDVRLEDGSITRWATILACFRRVQSPEQFSAEGSFSGQIEHEDTAPGALPEADTDQTIPDTGDRWRR